MAGTEIDIVGGPAVFRPQADGSTLAFYKRTDRVDSALWSPDNSGVTEQASYSPEQYEQYRQDHPELDLPAFSFAPPPLTGGYRGTGNTVGNITGEAPGSAGKAEAANPEVDKNLLEQAKDGIDHSIDDWVERSGYSTGAMIGGALAKAAVEVFMPTAYWELIPLAKASKIASKGAEAIGDLAKTEKAAEAGKDAGKAADKGSDAGKAPEKPTGGDGGKVKRGRSAEKGKCGEWLARQDMRDQGFNDIVEVQNNSGHGVDLIGRNSQTGEVKVWEVKTTDTARAGSLKGDQATMGGERFTTSRLGRAAGGRGNYGKVSKAVENANKAISWIEDAPASNMKSAKCLSITWIKDA
ncbi:MAG TPA: hypothetical protein DCQ80_00750 [Pseudomonas sp.]|nr:hypothetical protein [Pseudomonas sp.]